MSYHLRIPSSGETCAPFLFKESEVTVSKVFTLHLSKALHQILAKLAADSQRSMSGHLRWLILNAANKEGILNEDSKPKVIFQKEKPNRENKL